MSNSIRRIAIAALVGLAGTVSAMSNGTMGGIETLPTTPPGFLDLTRQFPGVQAWVAEDRVNLIYGKPMTAADTPDEAAAKWWADHGTAFGAGDLDLEQLWVAETGMGKFTVFGYQQHIDGLPVEYGIGRLMVLNGFAGEQDRVVYVAGKFAKRPEGGFGLPFVQANQAVGSVRDMINFEHLPVWTDAEMVIFQGDDTRRDPVLAWKFVGEEPNLETRERYTFFVDANSGALLHVRNEVLNIDVIGKLEAMGSPGTNPDIGSNPPVMMPMPDMRVVVQGGNNSYSQDNGDFVITHGGVNPVTVTSNLDNGLWVDVNDQSGTGVLSISGTFTPGVPGTLQYNTSPSQFTTAQVNAAIHTAKTHDYIRYRTTWTGMDFKCPANVNINSSCNAYFDGSSINFYRAAGGCNNTAYSSVVAHEYGHYIVARLGLSQGAFGEGYADTCSLLQYDDPIIGRNFTTSGGYVRYPVLANVQYPCSGGVHHCGQIIGGVAWRIRENFGATYGSAPGLAMVQQLHVDWSLITIGGIGNNSAHPATAIEWLTVDDNDGDISNGTPNFSLICAAFAAHSISCPALPPIVFTYPNGRPSEFDALPHGQATTFNVNIAPGLTEPVPSTARIYYSVDGGSYQSSLLTHLGGDSYTATIPGVDCDSLVNYFLQVQGTDSGFYTHPSDAPGTTHFTGALLFADTMDTNRGWLVGAPDDDATTGIWNRMKPQQTSSGGNIAQPGAAFFGENCYVTDGRAGSSIGEFDVDNGKTTLLTPVLDLTSGEDPSISYWRWYSNHAGASPYADIFVVDISNDGGVSWSNVEVVGPTGTQVEGGWYFKQFRVADYVSPTAAVRLRFVASDYGSGSIVEACVDDFRVAFGGCASDCYADCNGDTVVNSLDVICFLNFYSASDPAADCNGDTVVNSLDVICFLNAYTSGCP
ncbi:MAG: hypothetical protein DYG93_06410 [Leptolyngbya sp. PLA2]|nr:hypothetical protein [Leptolyngbya sp.]MCE7971281.1 hypothetical protein [Leptolyngbya sp. PL-A2]MCQ3939640.1 hypothetical protein [cyanobacterium CYA1]MCZ7632115.1 hypothetical protein [Phycisphaerales bacterium]MDL1903896.1 hypothetical protein [Synechococcales cyanobacterium CNB]GIK18610.1 MAG: hypothetical protein BroJett004_07740 [Planctomycetota bacterium]